MTARRAVRVLLVVLAVAQGTVGGWALFAPESFYRDFPGGGRGWVALPRPASRGFPEPDAVTQTAATIAQVVLVVVALLLSTRLPHRLSAQPGLREDRAAQTIRRS